MKQLFTILLVVAACGGAPARSPQLAAPAAQPAAAARSFRVEVTGRGAPIVLIPGLASSGAVWADTVAHLRERYTCHVLTLAGFAGAPPIDGPLLVTVSDELAAYIASRRLERPVVIGHSLGGTLALQLAADHPAAVGPLVIVDALPFYAGAWFRAATIEDARPMLDQMRAALAAQTDQQYAEQARSAAMTRYMVTSPAHLQHIVDWGVASDRRTVNDAMLELVGVDRRPLLAKIEAPALVLGSWAGLRDQLAAMGATIDRAAIAGTFEAQYAGLRRMHFAMADTARHFIMFDDPAWWLAQLDRFLAAPDASARERGFGNG